MVLWQKTLNTIGVQETRPPGSGLSGRVGSTHVSIAGNVDAGAVEDRRRQGRCNEDKRTGNGWMAFNVNVLFLNKNESFSNPCIPSVHHVSCFAICGSCNTHVMPNSVGCASPLHNTTCFKWFFFSFWFNSNTVAQFYISEQKTLTIAKLSKSQPNERHAQQLGQNYV